MDIGIINPHGFEERFTIVVIFLERKNCLTVKVSVDAQSIMHLTEDSY